MQNFPSEDSLHDMEMLQKPTRGILKVFDDFFVHQSILVFLIVNPKTDYQPYDTFIFYK